MISTDPRLGFFPLDARARRVSGHRRPARLLRHAAWLLPIALTSCAGASTPPEAPATVAPPAPEPPPPPPVVEPEPPVPPAESPSTVGATYVDPSATEPLQPGQKIGQLFERNMKQRYLLQRLTQRTYFFESQFYAATFYVGDKGVLLFDAPENRIDALLEAIAEVTPLPVTMLVYSHDHADHIGGARALVDALKKSGAKEPLRIIASSATAEKMQLLGSKLPKATDVILWPRGSFGFERLRVQFHGFERAAHSDDHGVWLLGEEKVAHVPDHINPDQPPFWSFGGSENFLYYEMNLEQLAKLDWVFLNGGHGNVGSKDDVAFYRTFIGDMKRAVGGALQAVAWGDGVDTENVRAHTVYFTTWLSAVAQKATDELRPKYGKFYGFDAATPRNAELVALTLFSYR
jgi:glyoxylase-like metal-dependent hydrolase (beta-lactamase superfamily II)